MAEFPTPPIPPSYKTHPLWPLRRRALLTSTIAMPIILMLGIAIDGSALFTVLLLLASALFVAADVFCWLHQRCTLLCAHLARSSAAATDGVRTPCIAASNNNINDDDDEDKPSWPRKWTLYGDLAFSISFSLLFASLCLRSMIMPWSPWSEPGLLVLLSYGNLIDLVLAVWHWQAYRAQVKALPQSLRVRCARCGATAVVSLGIPGDAEMDAGGAENGVERDANAHPKQVGQNELDIVERGESEVLIQCTPESSDAGYGTLAPGAGIKRKGSRRVIGEDWITDEDEAGVHGKGKGPRELVN